MVDTWLPIKAGEPTLLLSGMYQKGIKDGTVGLSGRELASHQCCPCSNSGSDASGFSSFFASPQNQHDSNIIPIWSGIVDKEPHCGCASTKPYIHLRDLLSHLFVFNRLSGTLQNPSWGNQGGSTYFSDMPGGKILTRWMYCLCHAWHFDLDSVLYWPGLQVWNAWLSIVW